MICQEPIWCDVTFGAKWQTKGRLYWIIQEKEETWSARQCWKISVLPFLSQPKSQPQPALTQTGWLQTGQQSYREKHNYPRTLCKHQSKTGLMELCYWVPCCLHKKWSRSTFMGQHFLCGNSPTFVLWSNCPLYVSVFQFLIHKSCLLPLPWQKMPERTNIPRMRENLAHSWPEMWPSSVLLSFTAFQVVISWYVVPLFSLQKRKQSGISYPSILQTESSSPLWWLLFALLADRYFTQSMCSGQVMDKCHSGQGEHLKP